MNVENRESLRVGDIMFVLQTAKLIHRMEAVWRHGKGLGSEEGEDMKSELFWVWEGKYSESYDIKAVFSCSR